MLDHAAAPALNDIYKRPDDYDLEHASDTEDARFYGHLLRRLDPTRVLELACGTGRVLSWLAATMPHAQLMGVDESPEMLVQAEKSVGQLPASARDRITLARGDMRTWETDTGAFDAVLIGCRSVSHLLSMDDRLRTWQRVHALLKPGGAFLVDVSMPDLATLAESQRVQPRMVLQLDVDAWRHTRAGSKRLMRSTATSYEPHLQQAHVRYFYDRFDTSAPDERFVTDFPCHIYFPSELDLLFACTGFEVIQRYGDYAFGPLDRTSPYLITLARRPAVGGPASHLGAA